jgi:acyl phosphate:glycerol-3-phosphate acyltransferase
MIVLKIILIVIGSYLIGSIPFGVLIGRKLAGVDVRKYGSGKMGMTNVLRTAGKKAAILVGVLDVVKGAIPVLVTGFILKNQPVLIGDVDMGVEMAQSLAALASILGHSFPIYMGFKGGRGVATFFGGLIALCPIAAIIGAEMLIISIGLTRYVSLGSIIGAVGTYAILIPLSFLNGFPFVVLIYSLIGAVFIMVMHRDNIARLLNGTERKLGEKATHPNVTSN